MYKVINYCNQFSWSNRPNFRPKLSKILALHTQCDFLVNSALDMATTMTDLYGIHRQLIYNICTDSRTFTRIFNKTRVNYKLFFILTKKLESMSFHIKI